MLSIPVLGVSWRDTGVASRRAPSPEERLRQRYAEGALTRQQYHEALVGLLKDRHVRGELDVTEDATRLGRLLETRRALP